MIKDSVRTQSITHESSAKIVDEIIKLIDQDDIQTATSLYEGWIHDLHPINIAKISTLIKQRKIPRANRLDLQLEKLLEDFKFADADELFLQNKWLLEEKDYWKKRKAFKTNYQQQQEIFLQTVLEKVRKAVAVQDFEQAEQYYREIEINYSRQDFERLVNQCRIENGLKKHRFIDADELQERHAAFTPDEYLSKKAGHIIQYFAPIQEISEEQALAIAADCKSLLIGARAGSGKTRTLAAKTRLLGDIYNVNPDRILVLAFNRDAANGIKRQITRDFGVRNFENARTFHSLAHDLVNPKTKLLFDNGTGEFDPKELSSFVQKVWRKIEDRNFRARLVAAFRKELGSIERVKALLDSREFYSYVRNIRDTTLGGQRVKSHGEKFIADFLFEHDIPYTYEKIYFWRSRPYKPDFTLYYAESTFFIEHWGIDPRDPESNTPDSWERSRKEYCREIREKRDYCKDNGITLIETSIADLRSEKSYPDRRCFEDILRTRLETLGIHCQRLPQEELEERVVHWQMDRMTRLFVQFIQKAKQQKWTPSDVTAKIQNHESFDERERIFLDLSSKVYEAYQDTLTRNNRLDFDQLLVDAAQIIRQSDGDCRLRLGRDAQYQHYVAIKDLKWILIDEYQDLSFLFFDLIQAIREVNPNVRLVCVGDDWQAINGFAGSDLKFMQGFSNCFPNAQIRYLLKNFRSERQIVESGNALMAGLGQAATHVPQKDKGEVNLIRADKIRIELQSGEAYREQKDLDRKFHFEGYDETGRKIKDNGFLQAKYLKACFGIITEPKNFEHIIKLRDEPGRISVAILSRNNRLYRVRLKDFDSRLRSIFSEEQHKAIGDFSSKIRIGTVHSFKGLEADIVILLGATQGFFPQVHPDNHLFRMFVETDEFGLQEEKRLFYVALSRASWKTYLLTETGNETEYLDDVFGNKQSNHNYVP